MSFKPSSWAVYTDEFVCNKPVRNFLLFGKEVTDEKKSSHIVWGFLVPRTNRAILMVKNFIRTGTFEAKLENVFLLKVSPSDFLEIKKSFQKSKILVIDSLEATETDNELNNATKALILGICDDDNDNVSNVVL